MQPADIQALRTIFVGVVAVLAALEGIENILKVGEEDKEQLGAEMNDFSRLVEEADGMDKLEALQSHANDEIYGHAVKILETYFDLDDEE